MCKDNYLIALSSHPNLSFVCTLSTSIDPFANTNINNVISTISFPCQYSVPVRKIIIVQFL